MPWARLDDAFWRNPKVLAAGNEAAGLYARALSYAADNGTAGLLPLDTVKTLAGSRWKTLSRKLVDTALWDPSGQNGWHIHDYDDPAYGNPTSSRARARSDAARKAAQARWGTGPPDAEPDAERMPGVSEPHSETHAERTAKGNANSMRPDASRAQAGATPTPSQPPSSSSLSNPPELSDAREPQPGDISEPIWRARKRAANGTAATLEGWDLTAVNRVISHAVNRGHGTADEAYERLLILAAQPETRSPGRLLEQAGWDWASQQLDDRRRFDAKRAADDATQAETRREHATASRQADVRRKRIDRLGDTDPDSWQLARNTAREALAAEGIPAPLETMVDIRALELIDQHSRART